jgi:hypothetical protein
MHARIAVARLGGGARRWCTMAPVSRCPLRGGPKTAGHCSGARREARTASAAGAGAGVGAGRAVGAGLCSFATQLARDGRLHP